MWYDGDVVWEWIGGFGVVGYGWIGYGVVCEFFWIVWWYWCDVEVC